MASLHLTFCFKALQMAPRTSVELSASHPHCQQIPSQSGFGHCVTFLSFSLSLSCSLSVSFFRITFLSFFLFAVSSRFSFATPYFLFSFFSLVFSLHALRVTTQKEGRLLYFTHTRLNSSIFFSDYSFSHLFTHLFRKLGVETKHRKKEEKYKTR